MKTLFMMLIASTMTALFFTYPIMAIQFLFVWVAVAILFGTVTNFLSLSILYRKLAKKRGMTKQ